MACSTTLLKLLGFLRNLNLSSEALGTPASPLKMGVASSNVVAHGFRVCGAFLRGADARVHFSVHRVRVRFYFRVFFGCGLRVFLLRVRGWCQRFVFLLQGQGCFFCLFSAGAGLRWLSAARARALLLCDCGVPVFLLRARGWGYVKLFLGAGAWVHFCCCFAFPVDAGAWRVSLNFAAGEGSEMRIYCGLVSACLFVVALFLPASDKRVSGYGSRAGQGRLAAGGRGA